MQFSGRGGSSQRRHFVEYTWSVVQPAVVARAMVLAGKTLFVAGPPDVLDEDAAPSGDLSAPETLERIAAQDAAMDGLGGCQSVLSGSSI